MVYTNGDEPVPGYRLMKFLGRGGFGEVWKASGPGGTQCALKIISLDGSQGLKEFRAIRLVKNVRHANLVPITAFWLKDEKGKLLDDGVSEADTGSKPDTDAVPAELIMAMGLGDKNLWDRLRECQSQGQTGIPPEELLDYMEGAARAIDHLNFPRHELGSGPVAIQHCDIKPQNIMIVGDAAQVCDFGLARVLGDARTTAASLSAAYAAPEFISESKPSKFTDQYSLAISYYELRTGALPFDTTGGQWKIIKDKVDGRLDISKLPEAERDVVARATHIEPDKRYPTTLEMVRALRRAYEGKLTDSGKGPGTRSGPLIVQKDLEIVPGYRLVRMLGRGSYGEVWEAAAPGGRHVALKIIQHLEAAEGKQEFKALQLIKNVDHEHLMELHAYWLLDKQGQTIPDHLHNKPNAPVASTLVIAGKLASKNLAQRLDECMKETGAGIPVDELLRYMRQAALAIDHLNQAQHKLDDRVVSIQHRDIKPENIMLAGSTVKVADFGLAKVVEGTSAVIHGDSAGLTLAYAAPEMFENKVTSWTDQYSLALTYYHLRTGGLPFRKGCSTHDIIRAHMEGRLDLSRLPKGEEDVIRKATALEPEDRYPSCFEMLQALEAAAGFDLGHPGSRGQFGPVSTGAGTTSGRGGSDPKRSGMRPRPKQEAVTATAGNDPFQTMANVPSRLRADAIDTKEAGLTDTDRPRPEEFTSPVPPWVRQDSSRQRKKTTQIRIAVTITIGLVCLVVGGVIWVLLNRDTGNKGGGGGKDPSTEIAQAMAVADWSKAYDLAKDLPADQRSAKQREIIHAWKSKAGDFIEASQFDKALAEADKGRFDDQERLKLLEGIRDDMLKDAQIALEESDFERARRQVRLLDPYLPGDAKIALIRQEIQTLERAGDKTKVLARLVQQARQAKSPEEKVRSGQELIDFDPKELQGYISKLDGLVTIEEEKKTPEPDFAEASKTLVAARALLDGKASAELDGLEGRIKKMVAAGVDAKTLNEVMLRVRKGITTVKPADFKALLKDCEQAARSSSDPAIQALLAECLIEAAGKDLKPADRKRAKELAETAKVADQPGYDLYVRALVLQADNNLRPAANEIVLAYKERQLSPALLNEHRLERAVDILQKAFAAHRLEDAFRSNPLLIVSENEMLNRLDHLYDWLTRLQELAARGGRKALTADERIHLALAAAYENESPARKQAVQLISELLDKDPGGAKLGPLAYTLLLHKARALEADARREEALNTYAQLLEMIRARFADQSFDPVAMYTAVLAPAVKLGEALVPDNVSDIEKAEPALRKQIGRLSFEAGKTLRDNPYANWSEELADQLRQRAFHSFDRAVRLDPEAIDYLIQRGYAHCDLPTRNLDAIRRDGEAFARQRPKLHQGHGLVGVADLLISRAQPEFKDHIPILKRAIQSLDKAIELCPKENVEMATLLVNSSVAHLELGNYQEEGREKNLTRAAADARTARDDYSRRASPENAHAALGNALEDLAWLLGKNENWQPAIDEFGKAINIQRLNAKPYMDRGRCYFKWVDKGGGDRSLLENALTDLKDVIGFRPTESVKAEALGWKGKVHALRAEFAEADQAFKLALEATDDKYEKAKLLLDSALLPLRDGLRRLALSPPDPQCLQRFQEVRSRAGVLKATGLLLIEAADVLRQGHEFEADYNLQMATREGSQNRLEARDRFLAAAEAQADALAKQAKEVPEPMRGPFQVSAAWIRGQALEGADKLQGALDAYNGMIPPSLDGAPPYIVPVLVARMEFFHSKGLKLRPGKAEVLAQARAMVYLARKGAKQLYLADALGSAANALAQQSSSGLPKEQDDLSAEVIKYCREAIDLRPDHRNNVIWRTLYGLQAAVYVPRLESNRRTEEAKALRKDALKELDLARKRNTNPALRPYIENARKSLSPP